ncbi:acyl-CoA reductase [Sandaracinus amylolyticus]|uniref:acyl-CoA reductase n=1 Tax=Sandaracinus amylolyticus TaxID=927083 RepID=UPI001F1E33EF|nr:acyl-CoA reductase [Sandaracinus amylolyticus]UJR84213.1 Hypothetical protein I5071_62850 [Sandaracinus amylolyticus]
MSDERPGEVLAINPSGSIDRVIARVHEAGEVLRAASHDRVIRAIAGAAARLGDPDSRVGSEARASIPMRSGLSEQNVEHALSTSLEPLREDRLRTALTAFERAHHGRTTAPVRLAGMVLASNVFSAALRPLAWSLLLRVPAVVKPSSGDEGLAELFAVALAESDAELADAIALLRFARSDAAMLSAMASRCDVVHAWGSDRSVAEIRASLSATTSFVAHGHGLGAVFVPRSALTSASAVEHVADEIGLDVALYDQRGCLSPHFVLVERGGNVPAIELARVLSERALASQAREMPRGTLPLAMGAMQVQWRGVGATRGELFEGDGWAVTYEADAALRLSPGWRNLAVHDVADVRELGARLAPFGVHLKALGVAGEIDVRWNVARALPAPLAPRVSETGAMQTPGLLAATDGEPPWSGFVRLVDVD